ncbi:MAG: Rrf2 family transcriptional regulator [Candidatus Gottesmanbacteria bacterium]|nr:Rrf2 family transcriptional regulator [Candidatus Gottesmanbacteria bacterium]
MFTIGSQSDYGLIILSSLMKKNAYVSLTHVVKETDLPQRFLARIAGKLVSHDLLTSLEGRGGGYKVTDKVKNMSLYSYLTIFEKNLNVCKCCRPAYQCHFQPVCQHGRYFQNTLTAILSNQLKKIKLVQIFSKG